MSKNIAIELTTQEIAFIQKCVSLPLIQELWTDDDAILARYLSVFFQELKDVDSEEDL